MAGRESGGWYRRSLGIQMKITEGRVRPAASDVANFLACRRLTQLDLLRARAVLEWFRAGVQKVEPRWMHLARGNGEFASFKVDDFAAYERQTRRLLEAAIGGDPSAEVYPRLARCFRSAALCGQLRPPSGYA